mmetsp:Transcript_24840/g.69246  ORF Transcript_24840/g.69246 Transcript_24840/m.69246 type:complete len:258 (+) Transcript_24840:694-1467(+)
MPATQRHNRLSEQSLRHLVQQKMHTPTLAGPVQMLEDGPVPPPGNAVNGAAPGRVTDHPLILLGWEVINVSVGAALEAVEELLLDSLLQLCNLLCPRLLPGQLLLLPGRHSHQRGRGLLRQLAHADEVLCYLGQPLLILVHQELWKVLQMGVQLFQRLRIALLQLDLLPEVLWGVGPLYGLNEQVASPFLLPYRGVSAVCEGAGAAVAKPRDIVLVSAKVLGLCLGTEAAVPIVDALPYHFVVLHVSPTGLTIRERS